MPVALGLMVADWAPAGCRDQVQHACSTCLQARDGFGRHGTSSGRWDASSHEPSTQVLTARHRSSLQLAARNGIRGRHPLPYHMNTSLQAGRSAELQEICALAECTVGVCQQDSSCKHAAPSRATFVDKPPRLSHLLSHFHGHQVLPPTVSLAIAPDCQKLLWWYSCWHSRSSSRLVNLPGSSWRGRLGCRLSLLCCLVHIMG